MSNNQDFILNNAIEVGKDTKVTLGTITSGTVDLSTGNYFAETLAADTTYVFSNPGDVQSFQLEVTGGVAGYDITSGVYSSKSLSVTTQSTTPLGMAFKPDGTKLYIAEYTNATIFEYSLSTAWDISTATYSGTSLVVSTNTYPVGMYFKDDGSTLYLTDLVGIHVDQYSLSTAWDITSASYVQAFSVTAQDTGPVGVSFKNDGTKMFVMGQSGDEVIEYALSTAWDISTASYTQSFFVTAQAVLPRGFFFHPDGTSFFVADDTTDTIYRYDMTTSWDISTAYINGSLSVSSQISSARTLLFNTDGTILYVLCSTNDAVYQYGMTSNATPTWPASVEWNSGTAPDAPAAGETDVYTFVTDDSGTTYIGLQTADAVS